jgi:voltage-gated potassium channel
MTATDSAGIQTTGQPNIDDPSGRLAAYLDKTQTPLDVLALLTLWIVVVPPWKFGGDASTVAWVARIGLSVIYGIDMAIRTALAARHWRYVRSHLLGLSVVLIPPLRILFSLRLIRSVFRRGSLPRFLLAATVLVVNGAVVVYIVERHAPGANIHTLGESLWWSVVTVATVGYGDYVPVTIAGRITACFIMAIGVLVLAVVTAQVASSFVAQASAPGPADQPADQPAAQPADQAVTLAELGARLERIEAILTARSGDSG